MRAFLILVLVIIIIAQIAFLFMKQGGSDLVTDAIDTTTTLPEPTGPALSTALSLSPSELARKGKRPVRTGIEILRGIVLDEANNPVPDATVHVLDRALERWDVFQGPRNISRWRAQTDAEGAFSIDTVPLGSFLVVAMTDDQLGLTLASVTNRGSAGDAIVRLEPTRAVKGQVLDDAGQPVDSARVYAIHGRDPRDNPWAFLPATTDKEGKFHFDKMTGAPAAFLATTSKKVSALVEPDAETGPIVLQVQPPGGLVGYLIEAETDRTAGRTGIILTEATYGLESHKAFASGSAGFRFEGIRPGTYRVGLESRKYVLNDSAMVIEMEPGANERVELLARSGASVRGRVVGEDGRRGAQGVTVRLVSDIASTAISETATDSGGTYSFQPLPPGRYTVSVAGTHAELTEGNHTFRADHGSRVAGPVFQLQSGTIIRGMVTTADGSPASGANVNLVSDNVPGLRRVAIVNSDGGFEIDDAPPGDAVRVWAEHLGFASTPYFSKTLPAEGVEKLNFQLSLDSRGLIAGSVASNTGEPIAHATVTCFPEHISTAPQWKTVTGLDGGFQFENLTEGTYRLVFEADAGSLSPEAQQRIALDAGQQVTDARLTIDAGE